MAPLKERTMNHDTKTTPRSRLDPAELATLGEGQVAYVKPLQSDEVASSFLQAPKIQPGLQLFALAVGQRRADPPRPTPAMRQSPMPGRMTSRR